jgi:hypothetical protein
VADNDSDETPKEPFVSQTDRPEVRIKSDTPLSELRVRDLASLLAQFGFSGKDFIDGKDWIKDDVDGPGTKWKDKEKDKDKEKPEKWEKPEKSEKFEKQEKFEKPEKPETKEAKAEKIETDGVFEPRILPVPDPRIDQVIQTLSGLTSRVAQLANQIEELKKADEG